ncbi:hypothetical protein LIER_20441 [Lithospermum erythrorhizon]|uniref:Uncharacterized protein n=1 Tax=Lithospermum erythrorhizon TaxID=34254 RepID=A0AAV3QNR9_LITER
MIVTSLADYGLQLSWLQRFFKHVLLVIHMIFLDVFHGICDNMTLAFYLVAYHDIGGIACRRIWDSSGSSSGHAPVFRASSTTLSESQLSAVEEHVHNSCVHVQPLPESEFSHEELPPSEICDVSRMLNIE